MKLKRILMIFFLVCAMLLSLALMLYPIISVQVNDAVASSVFSDYQSEIAEQADDELEAMLEAARSYNLSLLEGGDCDEYDTLLDPLGTGLMGYVEIPKIDVTIPIYHGCSDAVLAKGAGHVVGTSLPVGGSGTHCSIAAHTGLANTKLFSDLDQLVIGDVFYISVLGQTLTYQVDQILTVEPTDTESLNIVSGKDYVTLITCTPFAVNTHRLLVRGTRIKTTQETSDEVVSTADEVEATKAMSTWTVKYLQGLGIGFGIFVVFMLVVLLARWQIRRLSRKK